MSHELDGIKRARTCVMICQTTTMILKAFSGTLLLMRAFHSEHLCCHRLWTLVGGPVSTTEDSFATKKIAAAAAAVAITAITPSAFRLLSPKHDLQVYE